MWFRIFLAKTTIDRETSLINYWSKKPHVPFKSQYLHVFRVFCLYISVSRVNNVALNKNTIGYLKYMNCFQLLFAGILSAVYSIAMILVLVGILKVAAEDGFCSTTTTFLCFVVGIFILSAILHPKVNTLHIMISFTIIWTIIVYPSYVTDKSW